MSEAVLFLLGAVALSALGGLVVWVLNRPRREKFGTTIDVFNRDLNALAPPGTRPSRKRRRPLAPPAQGARRQNLAPGPTQQRPATRGRDTQPGTPAMGKVAQTSPRPRPGPRPRQNQR